MAWLSTELYFYPASAPCRAVMLTLKALKVDYEEKVVDLLKAENKRPWFVRLNRLQTVPVFNDQGFVLSESRAIMMYLCNKYATEDTQFLYPKDAEERGKVDKMLFFDMGTLTYAIKEYFAQILVLNEEVFGPLFGAQFYLKSALPQDQKPLVYQGMSPDPEKENLLKQSLDYLDGFLEDGGTPFICGEKFTIADLSILAQITDLDALNYSYKCYGELTRYIERLKQQLPFYKECCEKGIQMTKERVKQLEEELKKQIEKERKASLKK